MSNTRDAGGYLRTRFRTLANAQGVFEGPGKWTSPDITIDDDPAMNDNREHRQLRRRPPPAEGQHGVHAGPPHDEARHAGTGAYRLNIGQIGYAKVFTTALSKKVIRRRGPLKVEVLITALDEDGGQQTLRRAFTLRSKK